MLANEMRDQFMVQYEKITSNGAPGLTDADLSLLLTNAQLNYVLSRISRMTNSKKEGLEETEVRMQGLSALVKDSAISASSVTTENLPNGSFWDLPRDFMYTIMEMAYVDKLDCTKYYGSRIKGNYNSSVVYSKDDIVYDAVNRRFYESLINNNNLPLSNTTAWKEIDGDTVPIRVITHNEFTINEKNPFRKPYYSNGEGEVWRIAYSRDVSGYNDPTTVTINGYNYIASQTPKRHELITDGMFNVIKYKLRYLRFPREIIVDTVTPLNQRHCELDEQCHQVIVDIAVRLAERSLENPRQENMPDLHTIE